MTLYNICFINIKNNDMSTAEGPTNEDFNKVFASIEKGQNTLLDRIKQKEESVRKSERNGYLIIGFTVGVVFSCVLYILLSFIQHAQN